MEDSVLPTVVVVEEPSIDADEILGDVNGGGNRGVNGRDARDQRMQSNQAKAIEVRTQNAYDAFQTRTTMRMCRICLWVFGSFFFLSGAALLVTRNLYSSPSSPFFTGGSVMVIMAGIFLCIGGGLVLGACVLQYCIHRENVLPEEDEMMNNSNNIRTDVSNSSATAEDTGGGQMVSHLRLPTETFYPSIPTTPTVGTFPKTPRDDEKSQVTSLPLLVPTPRSTHSSEEDEKELKEKPSPLTESLSSLPPIEETKQPSERSSIHSGELKYDSDLINKSVDK